MKNTIYFAQKMHLKIAISNNNVHTTFYNCANDIYPATILVRLTLQYTLKYQTETVSIVSDNLAHVQYQNSNLPVSLSSFTVLLHLLADAKIL